MSEKKKCNTYIGGQAVLEGVMMRGKTAMATAVRDDEGNIQIEASKLKSAANRPAFFKWPIIRGAVNLIDSLVSGTKTLMRSAEVYAGVDDTEPSGFEKWLSKTFKADIMSVITGVSVFVGILLAVVLFVFLPYLCASLIATWTGLPVKGVAFNFIEGGFRILIFIGYLFLTGLMKDIHRTYMYHGAEHKTITCFERGMPLTVENVRSCKRVHDRCGTTFMFLVMVIAILIFSVANSFIPEFSSSVLTFIVRLAVKLILLPVVAGVSYEILKLLAKTDSPLVYPLKAPGLALQHLTTREPEDDMIECAIAAFERVLAMDKDRKVGESSFAVAGKLSEVKEHVDELFARAKIEGDDADWIFSLQLGIAMSELKSKGDRDITVTEARRLYKVVNERLTGRPLWYVIGDTSFCGYTIQVDERVLIPRPETEVLAEYASAEIQDGDRVLDLCTGSGALAVALSKMSGKKIEMVASDISEEALALAKENAEGNEAEITFVRSDLWENVDGKFQLIVSNPPYIPAGEIEHLQREVKDFEPRLALDGGADGLEFYRKIAAGVKEHLTEGGKIFLEVGMGQAKDVKAMLESEGAECEIIRDLAGVERIVKGTF
jgi:release factor-specific protein-(glutamine-N5) methyltransferase